LNQLEETPQQIWAMTFKDQSWLEGGDAEWYTTAGDDADDFYGSALEIRDVAGIKSTNTMANGSVCVYGRATNVRTCNHTVEATFVNVNAGGVAVGDLARATNDQGAPGDSGAPWFFGNTAWGILHGGDTCPGCTKVFFTTIEEAEDQLGVGVEF
jgi:hypothetical protein